MEERKMRIALSFMIALTCSLLCSSCQASTRPDVSFPFLVSIPEGNVVEYKSGDIDVTWSGGDTVTFDYVNGTLVVNGLPHFPHPRVMKSETALAAQYGNVPWVRTHFNATVAYPWNTIVQAYESILAAATRSAEETYVSTHDANAAKKVLEDSGLFTNIQVTTLPNSDHLALSYEYLGMESGPVYLSMKDEIPPPAKTPTLSLEQAKDMTWRYANQIRSDRFRVKVILQEGNEQVTAINEGR
jgi:hypothetical protein